MNKKNMQRLNRAAVATVLAASGVATAIPYTVVKADSPFKDLKESNSHYEAIMQLYNRDIISGFNDGTFQPNKGVTRGQAAKMLASILGLELQNVSNPNFKDVSTKNGYYRFIAALVDHDIMNGYKDGTFRPNEVITRNQMAKILVRGFQLDEASALTHTFEDVSAKNANRFYIQTLLNLRITEGTSAITYSPSKAVTRGQLASFLTRAEKANVSDASVKEISRVEQVSGVTYVYVNGVKHSVHTSLRDMLHVRNTEILRGAQIEGTIVGTEIRTLNKITFNASGAKNNALTFEGNNSTFRGAVAITGNHLRFANWNVTGEVSIVPVETKTFSSVYKPLTMRTVASLKAVSDNIDWGTITPPSVTEPDENDGLVEIPADNKPVLQKLKTVEHDIQFVNVNVRVLVITANRTKIRSNIDLAHVTVGGFVREFELHVNVGELYLESDENVTFYGVSEIEKLFKNSYKSVNLYADSVTQFAAVDNTNGWIDLGDYYYIDKMVIPPDALPHDIFNDFLNDTDKIGDIEDPSGNEIDRDPIENTIVPDQDPPTLLIKNIETQLATANITVNADEDGTIHYVVKKENDGEPSIREIMQYTGTLGGNKAVSAGEDTIISVPDLEDEQSYIFYAVAVDEAGNISVKKYEPFEILDASPPNIEPASIEALPGGTRLEVTMTPDEPGDYVYYYEPLPSLGANTYSTDEILDFAERNYRGQTGKDSVTEAGEMKFRITNLTHQTAYAVYVVMKDEHGNTMAEPKILTATTTELDDVYPYITDGKLYPTKTDFYEFELNVNEPLDPETANDINNYELSGTAILNVDGQPTTIKPDRVTYVEGQTKITIRVPSATALVNGDTIVVKVLPGVTDLAENQFVNVDVVQTIQDLKNTASYVHDDSVSPTLVIEGFQPNAENTTGILTYRANKAGTYYYMIVPNSYNMSSVSRRDFYNMFIGENAALLNAIKPLSMQGDTGTNTVVVGSQNQSIVLPPSTDPFESYSLYMVVKDRSGQLSDFGVVKDIIDDSKAPFVRSLTVVPEEGRNDRISITLSANEGGRVFYKRFLKNTQDPAEASEMEAIRNTWQTLLGQNTGNHNAINNEIAKGYISKIRSWSNEELRADTTTVIKDTVSPHKEYVYFFAVQDHVGNITMYPSKMTGTTEGYGDNIMEETVFSDGIDPFINEDFLRLITKQELNGIPLINKNGTNPIVNPSSSPSIGDGYLNHITQQTFKMTFSEAIKFVGAQGTQNVTDDTAVLTNLKTPIEARLNGLTITDMEWQDTTSLGTWQERALVFTVSTMPSADITIDANVFKDFRDIAKPSRSFDPLKTNPIYKARKPNVVNGLRGAVLGGTPVQTSQTPNVVWQSKSIIATVELNVLLDRVQEYYYIVQNATDNQVYTPEEIVNYVNGYRDGVSGVFVSSKGQLTDSNITPDNAQSNNSISIEIVAIGSNVFSTGQKLHVVTVDEYGNIVGSQTEHANPKSFLAISKLN